jgi:hypothetical protein
MKNVFFIPGWCLDLQRKKKNWIKTIKCQETKNKIIINIGTGVNRHDK